MSRVENSRRVINAQAKLNLILDVTGRRNDGYHILSMFNVLVDLADVLTIELREDSEIDLRLTGVSKGAKGDDIASPDNNIVVKAVRKFNEAFGVSNGASIHLDKRIPIGAGLGGGSSDAAAVFSYLAGIHKRTSSLDVKKVSLVAASLGADVPFFLQHQSAFVTGIGESVSPCIIIDGSKTPVYVFYPNLPLATKEVFQMFARSNKSFSEDRYIHKPASISWSSIIASLHNDLESSAVALIPQIGELLAELRSITGIASSMTGSGSALFCLSKSVGFSTEQVSALEKAAHRFGCTLYQCHII